MITDSIISTANDISNGATTISSVLRTLNSIVSKNMSSSEIRERYTNGFYNTSSTIYTPTMYSKMFDEPTYLTFRIEFDFSSHKEENLASTNAVYNVNTADVFVQGLDKMPEPLLSCTTDESNNYYSTFTYLDKSLGETYRSRLLKNFITGLQDIQNNYPYYFTSIEGLNSLSKVNPQQGIRVNNENSTITIKCIEGLDLKITSLMQMYRKIVWDDVYQRWILPDMMRYFGINIYVSEIRLFHSYALQNDKVKVRPGMYDFGTNFLKSSTLRDAKESLLSRAGNILNTAIATSTRLLGNKNITTQSISVIDGIVDTIKSVNSAAKSNAYKLCDHAINDFMPTIKYECHMCEFDISDSIEHISSLSSSRNDISSPTPLIKIKVGNVKENMIFPLQYDSLKTGISNGSITYSYAENVNTLIDDDLQVEATWRSKSQEIINVITDNDTTYNKYVSSNGISIDAKNSSISKKRNRINSKYGELVNDEDYTPMEIPVNSAIQSLIQGSLNYVFDKTNLRNLSSATYTNEKVSNVYANNNISSQQSAASTRSIINHESIYKLKDSLDNLNTTIKNSTATYNNLPLGKFPQSVTNKNILTAGLALSNVVNNVYDGNVINSTDVDEQTKFNISENIFKEILDKISNSQATDNDTVALKVLANMISEDYKKEKLSSTATSKTKFSDLN